MNEMTNDSPYNRSTWQIPSYTTPLWQGKRHSCCIVIPVINEGERIRNLLSRMAALNIEAEADIIIVDGGSKDGSLELNTLMGHGVRGLLVKTGPGKLSAQLRCAYAFALDQGYEGIVTIDGNDKDDPAAIPQFIAALDAGYDFVQASRFISGGVAENTPASRNLAIRLLHAPLLSLSSGFHWTDTTQGFRAYSKRLLLDHAINPFRDEFQEYELLAYLSHRAPQMGFKCIEIGTARRYPKGEVPTKISAVRGNLKVLRTLFMACMGRYNQPGYLRRLPPGLWPITALSFLGALLSLLAFFPGWMSPDSVAQYTDAQRGIFSDWHPVFMAWWWQRLDGLYAGPGLFLLQNVLMYWGAFGLFAAAARYRFGRAAYLFPLAGFWPGLAFPLGQIWKDIAFGSAMLLAWGILVHVFSQGRKPRIVERVAIFLLAAFGCGVKTNGIVVLPFLFAFWIYTENLLTRSRSRQFAFCLALTALVAMVPYAVVPNSKIISTSPFQYTQTYDLLAISVKTGRNEMPAYVSKHIGTDIEKLKSLYFPGGNDLLFYNVAGNLTTTDKADLQELRRLWWRAIRSHPRAYLEHRVKNFVALLRLGENTPAMVAFPGTVGNPYNFSFVKNKFSDWLGSQPEKRPSMFFPWIYFAGLVVATVMLVALEKNKVFILLFSGSAWAFILPHLFIAPAADYRYLYYGYLISIVCILIAVFSVFKKTLTPHTSKKTISDTISHDMKKNAVWADEKRIG